VKPEGTEDQPRNRYMTIVINCRESPEQQSISLKPHVDAAILIINYLFATKLGQSV